MRTTSGTGSGSINVLAFDGSAEGESGVHERPCTPGAAGTPGRGTATTPGAATKPTAVRADPRFTG